MPSPARTVKAPQLDFRVTADIIATATPKDSAHCMIADALRAAMPRAEYVSVDLATIRFTDRAAGLRYIYLTPRAAQDALLAFDQGEAPEPFNVKARATQMVKTGIARRAKRITDPAPDAPKPPRKRREPAELLMPTDNNAPGAVPIKVGGLVPPIGPMAKGAIGQSGAGRKRTTRRREFGLRAFAR